MPQMALSWMVATPMPLAPPPAACHATRSICAHGLANFLNQLLRQLPYVQGQALSEHQSCTAHSRQQETLPTHCPQGTGGGAVFRSVCHVARGNAPARGTGCRILRLASASGKHWPMTAWHSLLLLGTQQAATTCMVTSSDVHREGAGAPAQSSSRRPAAARSFSRSRIPGSLQGSGHDVQMLSVVV
jgi:hypothetical protein